MPLLTISQADITIEWTSIAGRHSEFLSYEIFTSNFFCSHIRFSNSAEECQPNRTWFHSKIFLIYALLHWRSILDAYMSKSNPWPVDLSQLLYRDISPTNLWKSKKLFCKTVLVEPTITLKGWITLKKGV